MLLPREAIEADYESVFAKVRSVYGKGEAPRTLNFITGPSRPLISSKPSSWVLTGRGGCISSLSAEFGVESTPTPWLPEFTTC